MFKFGRMTAVAADDRNEVTVPKSALKQHSAKSWKRKW